jgi:anti-anti-sigma factor
MEVSTEYHGDLAELKLRGMLDSTWADHLSGVIDEVIRGGSHRLLLDFRDVTYLSSAGISVLLRAPQQLQRIHGAFGVCDPSVPVRQILKLSGLEKRLVCDADSIRQGTGTQITATTQADDDGEFRHDIHYQSYRLAPESVLECAVFGHPGHLPERQFDGDVGRSVPFDGNSFGLGLGAFGDSVDECRDRFGEFLAVAGATVQLPSRGNATPDYHLARESFVPEILALYGVRCRGSFRSLIRFEPARASANVPLATFVDDCLAVEKVSLAGMAFIAETAGLVGASLKRSPATQSAPTGGLFQHPEVRNWLSFSPERVHQRSLALVVGIAARSKASPIPESLLPLLRPLDAAGTLLGHFHAAVFSYRPIKKRKLDLHETVNMLFDTEDLHGVLHLLGDYREISGAGDSEFVSGACWIGPIESAAQIS